MSEASFFGDLLQTIAERGRRLLARGGEDEPGRRGDLRKLSEALLSNRGEASGIALAKAVLDRWTTASEAERRAFMTLLLERYGPDEKRLGAAVAAYSADPSARAAQALHAASESRRLELMRRLNLAPGGTSTLVRMRESLLDMKGDDPALSLVDDDFAHLFASWFNRGFLVLKPIDWASPANVLEKIIRYEAVHEIRDWGELRRRVEPADRRCYAFFHPTLVDEPLIFVEVALTTTMPASVDEVLDPARAPIRAEEANAAVFYSISNCQDGLRGVSFGNFLIKQVVEDLRRDLPDLSTFVTLSPVPGFAAWLARETADEASLWLTNEDRATLEPLAERGWMDDAEVAERLKPILPRLCAAYLLHGRDRRGGPADPVARFHLGNGARLERVNFMGDRSARAERQAHSMMVNYLYELDEIEANHEAFFARGEVAASSSVRRLAPKSRSLASAREVTPAK
ncbi:malonyl-CoA decarboxylase [Hansschlegelia quercus]|uniref:MCD, Malonyl-CoA decarboxylase MCD n=1 Tax=Hansschlegelia quercus TaxID=2528245 RepID=A0A4Q9GGA9_9HYPH|nr:malonyl-CoA decarboxylase [Hansschlegelia quercus]TBN52395.1 MCD, Malonyl-CoA decarboxylase MCD [Hansschlegelia quercus]